MCHRVTRQTRGGTRCIESTELSLISYFLAWIKYNASRLTSVFLQSKINNSFNNKYLLSSETRPLCILDKENLTDEINVLMIMKKKNCST